MRKWVEVKKGFTLLEVLLSVAVMSAGVLSVVVLYSMGFRETRQSREDVASAAYADAVISPLVNAITATNLKWSVFKDLTSQPSASDNNRGWAAYYDSDGNIYASADSMAQSAFNNFMGQLRRAAIGSLDVPTAYPTAAAAGLKAGLIIIHDEDSALVKIGFRASRAPSMLLSAPLYYTEAHFQGVSDQ